MQELLNKSTKHMLWKDELGDEFLLFKNGEIFINDENTLKIHTWSVLVRSKLAKTGLIIAEDRTDDPLWLLVVDRSNLTRILSLVPTHKRRPYTNGKFIKQAEIRLAHKILPYRPASLRK